MTTMTRTLLASFVLLGGVMARAADEPAGLKLLRPDSLVGWDYAATPPAHWTNSQGRLSGSALSSELLSGWTLGDFALRFDWTVGSAGAWNIVLPDVPKGAGLTIALNEGDGCGAVREGNKSLATGASIPAPAGGDRHRADIRRSGETLLVIVDGRVVSETKVDRNRRFGLALRIASGEATLDNLRLEEPRGNPLANGRDTSGWFVNNDKGTWTVDNGDFIPTSHRGLHYLRTDKEYGNFTFSFDYKISKGGNSGIAIRTAKDGWPSGDGMELQILDQLGEVKDSTMSIYGNLPPLDRADLSEQWNRVVVKADGRMISAWVNGELVQQANTSRLSELKHRHLRGWIGFQDHGGKVRFREPYVYEAPDGMGLDAWYEPRPENGAEIVLDRLMNSERLSRADGLTSGVVGTSIPKGGEHVVAELKGPGAVVRLWRTFAAGRLAFFFDGEEQPRIECPAEHVFDDVPGAAHQEQPTLMCLPYAKSLKIVASDPLAATYRVDYVTFPSGVVVESYTTKQPGIPRGMLAAINYRHEGLTGGKLREAEIYERINSEERTIEPGTTVELARLDGAGIVNWLKLRGASALVASEDLWLEVTIDGESLPAIAAPARYWFPAYTAGAKDFDTLVMAVKEGAASLLAMPYGKGLSVAAHNRGSKPIEKVAISMSVDRASDRTKDDYRGRMRLRGIFEPAGSPQSQLCRQLGKGRWVALIYDQPAGASTGIASCKVDGRDCPGWPMADLDAFWGKPGEGQNFYRALSGRRGTLAWRYLVLEPVSFESSLELVPTSGSQLGNRLALFYVAP
jgi:hypothetical protein